MTVPLGRNNRNVAGQQGSSRFFERNALARSPALGKRGTATLFAQADTLNTESFSTLHGLQVELNDHVRWHDHFRLHSKLGYVSPVEFRNAGLSL